MNVARGDAAWEAMVEVSSRDNPVLQRLRRLLADPTAYRKLGECWLEGEHLAQALAPHGLRASCAVLAQSARQDPRWLPLVNLAERAIVVPDRLWVELSSLPAAAGFGLLLPVPAAPRLVSGVRTVVLDRLQDAGNVGSILRSAAALGVRQVVALRGTAGLWSAKVLRAGMGAHFALHLCEAQGVEALDGLQVPWLATSSHAGALLPDAQLPDPCAWLFGHEGQGVGAELMARCSATVCIPQPGGEESLNVAAAAAICLYESMRRTTVDAVSPRG